MRKLKLIALALFLQLPIGIHVFAQTENITPQERLRGSVTFYIETAKS